MIKHYEAVAFNFHVFMTTHCLVTKGAINFYREGGRLSVMAGHHFFLVPPFAYVYGIHIWPTKE